MALLDNMYAPYSHLMQRAFSNASETDPSITRLNSSNESSPPTSAVHHHNINRSIPAGHYGGTVMTMNLKLEQTNFRPFVHPESPAAQENNINEDNRKDVNPSKVKKQLYPTLFCCALEVEIRLSYEKQVLDNQGHCLGFSM